MPKLDNNVIIHSKEFKDIEAFENYEALFDHLYFKALEHGVFTLFDQLVEIEEKKQNIFFRGKYVFSHIVKKGHAWYLKNVNNKKRSSWFLSIVLKFYISE